MAEPTDYDVLIVGAGIAGSALALALAQSNLRIGVIEAQPLALATLPEAVSVQDFDARVSALTPRSRQFLETLDCWPLIDAYRHCPYHHMTVWDAQGTGQIDFDRTEVDAATLGYIVENRAIVNALLEPLMSARNVQLISGSGLAACEVDGHACVELEDGSTLSAELLVAADGALSRVRQWLNFQTREWDYGHRAIVTTAQFESSHDDTAWQRFLPSGPLALLPLPGEEKGVQAAGSGYVSIVWSIDDDAADALLAMSDTDFGSALAEAAEHRLGNVLACSPRIAFPLRQRHAVDYVQSRVALVGDAAHTIHPLAGQGVNLGLQDVAVLAEEILAGVERGISPGQLALLQRYQRRRKGENLLMMAAMDGFKRLFEEPALPVRWLRNAGMRSVDRMLPVKQQLMRHAMGVG